MNPLTDAEIEALPVPTNVEIYEHQEAGGNVWMRWGGSESFGRVRELHDTLRWEINPCGCYGPQWIDGRGVFTADDYRLIPLTLYFEGKWRVPPVL